jgi:hypothetical protein
VNIFINDVRGFNMHRALLQMKQKLAKEAERGKNARWV